MHCSRHRLSRRSQRLLYHRSRQRQRPLHRHSTKKPIPVLVPVPGDIPPVPAVFAAPPIAAFAAPPVPPLSQQCPRHRLSRRSQCLLYHRCPSSVRGTAYRGVRAAAATPEPGGATILKCGIFELRDFELKIPFLVGFLRENLMRKPSEP